jgi:hypothetical protein
MFDEAVRYKALFALHIRIEAGKSLRLALLAG